MILEMGLLHMLNKYFLALAYLPSVCVHADCSLLSLVQVRSAPLRQMMTILIQVLANDD